jgi:hypothetical protein
MARRGLGVGLGKGYKNLAPADSHIHYLSAKGIKMQQPFFKGVKLGHSPLELTLYVPSTFGESKIEPPAVRKKRINEAESTMSRIFGGTTEVSAVGRWYNNAGKFVREPIGKVTSYTTPKDFNKGKREFESYVKRIADKYGQTSIALEYEGDLFFFNAPKTKGENK